MTTPRDDIAGLIERLKAYEGRNFETTACYNGTRDEAATQLGALSAELAQTQAHLGMRNSDLAEAERERDALSARVKELERENDALRDGAQSDVIVSNWFDLGRELNVPEGGSVFDTVIALQSRALRAEQERDQWRTQAKHETDVAQAAVEEIASLQQERDELQQVFDSRWDADQRAIKAWQAAHPERKTIWPDHADMVVWLLERADRLQQERDEAYERAANVADQWLESSWVDEVFAARSIADAIRRLSAGPEKEKK